MKRCCDGACHQGRTCPLTTIRLSTVRNQHSFVIGVLCIVGIVVAMIGSAP